MKTEKIAQTVQDTVADLNVSPDNLVAAVVRLLEIAHAHGLDAEATEALAECGIVLEVEEE